VKTARGDKITSLPPAHYGCETTPIR